MAIRKLLLILTVCAFCETYRTRRETQTYTIDIKVVTDVEMYTRWSTWVRETSSETDATKLDTLTQNMIQDYVSLCFHQANVRLATLPFVVQLQLVAIEFNYSAANSNNVNAVQTLNTFKAWLIKYNQSNLIDLYDHVMLFTSKPLASVTSSSEEIQGLGHAYVGTMCNKDGTSSSVIEDRGGFQSSYQIAHEIAHSLGAKHDGESSCSDTDSYLMSGLASDPVATRWIFSSCSANSIKTYINSILQSTGVRNSCLTTNSPPLKVLESSVATDPGQNYKANQQCQMMYGIKSHVCYDSGFSNIGEICTSMFCLDPSKTGVECKKHFAAEGTSCGDGKWCRQGICTSNSKAPVIGSCSLGDNVNIFIVDGIALLCAQAVAAAPALCYQSQVSTNCCASCEKIKINVADCMFGNKVSGCYDDKIRCSEDAGFASDCCGTCQAYNTVSTTKTSLPSARGSAPAQTGHHVMVLLVWCSTLATIFIKNQL